MPKPPKTVEVIDQRKAGLQDDHDPHDIGQKQNDLPNTQREGGQHVNEGKGDFKAPKQPAGPYDREKQSGGKVDSQGLPADDSKFG